MTTPIRESDRAKLRRLRDSAREWADAGHVFSPEDADYYNIVNEWLPRLLDQIAADRALLEAAAVGLEPFAWTATEIDEMGGDIWPDGDFFRVALGHLRAARALLAKLRPTPCDAPTQPLRPGLPDSEDTHQDHPFGAGGQEKHR